MFSFIAPNKGLDFKPLMLYLYNMIQNLILKRLKRNASAVAKFEKIRKANEIELVNPRPKLLPPKYSLAEIEFILSMQN